MKLRQFLSILGVIALVAVIYSPSTLSFSSSPFGDGSNAPTDTSASGTSMFLAYLQQSGYHVTVATTSAQATADIQASQKLVYLLVGPDARLPTQELEAFQFSYDDGRLSALIAEGNTTNLPLLGILGASTSGAAITDKASIFQDQQVFTTSLAIGSTKAVGVIDIASPLEVNDTSTIHLQPVATSSPISYDSKNQTVAPRTVVAAGISSAGSRVVVTTDSAPFTNYLFNYTQGGVDETAFVVAMLAYVDPGKATPILFDASTYLPPQPPKYQAGVPIGPLVAYAIEQSFAGLNSYYASFPSQVSGFLGGLGIPVSPGLAGGLVAAVILLSVYGAITRWFAPEVKGKDDQALPSVERTIVAESKARTDFLETSRSKAGYLAALAQLYEVLDSIALSEFGKGISSLDERALAAKVGTDEAAKAKKLFLSLSKLHGYATGETRFLFPPVLRWRALTLRTTGEAEAFLNKLGMTIAGEDAGSGQRVEQLMRERSRA